MEEKKTEKIKKPSFFLYYIIAPLLILYAKLHWRLKIDRKGLNGLKGPVLAVSTHASTIDAVPVLATLWPKSYNIITARDLFTWKQLKPFIKSFGAIPINQAAMDLASLRTMKNAVEQGKSLLLFPEGKTSLDGKQQFYMNPSIGKLIKFLDVPVVMVKTSGAYVTKPRYIKGFRKGKMEAKGFVLFDAEQVKSMKPAEIYEVLKENFRYNDNVWQQENKIKFRAKELASNLNYILYKCPRCGEEYKMSAEKDLLKCNACGNTVRYSADGHLLPIGDAVTIDRLDLWVDYERESIREELSREDFRLEKPVTCYVRDDEKHDYVEQGEGYLFINREKIGYVGTKDGAEWRAELPLANMPEIVTKNSEGVDLLLGKNTYRFLFKERKYSAKYGLIVEELFAERHGISRD